MTASPEPTRMCARCKAEKPLAAFDLHNGAPRKNCKECVALGEAEKAARQTPVTGKPEGWKAPAPGETPMKACTLCGESKVWSAYETGSDICRACMVLGPPPWGTEPADEAPRGERPTAYTPALGAAIAEQIAAGATLKVITAQPDMPSKDTLARWRLEHEDLAAMLAAARQARADSHADEIAELVEAVRTGRVDAHAGRVAIDGLRWLASKDAPQTYGDKVELSNRDGSLKAVTAAAAIEALIAALPDLMGGKAEAPKALTADPAPAESAEHKEAA
jgi:hypothetical protein